MFPPSTEDSESEEKLDYGFKNRKLTKCSCRSNFPIGQPNDGVRLIIITSISGRDEPNPVRRLATRADKKASSCPLGITRCVPQENSILFRSNKSFIEQACSVKMAGYLPRCFVVFLAQKQRGQY